MTLKIVFMGTPDFAVWPLKALHAHGHNISLVVTQPDRPKGRGRKLVAPPVKQIAQELGYEITQPESVKTQAFSEHLSSLRPDLIVVVAFGRILPKPVLDIPRMGAVNIHASLLPKYRGAAPIQWAIINGEKETGVTTMLIDEGLDTGDILLSSKISIHPDDTSATLHDRLADLGARLLIQTLTELESGSLTPAAQNDSMSSYAPTLKKADGQINWEKPAQQIANLIRGVTPWPGAFTFHNGKRFKIFRAEAISKPIDAAAGTIIESFPEELLVATGSGALSILEIQGASGKRLSIRDFLQGYKIPPGSVLSKLADV